MLLAFPFVFGVLAVAPEAAREAGAAKSQQQTQGTITPYDQSGHTQCSYAFEISEKSYNGKHSAGTPGVVVDVHVPVFYDSQDPSVNALEDSSVASRKDWSFSSYLFFVVGIFPGVIVSSKAGRTIQQERKAG
ncbi:hypothetical protein [Acidipila sp. EB88]|uniref:hypothetical protein n=1 Tax=Acidipila sp. EB88 TaxID=2305226 RepID=UPI000F5F4CF4|nr:hypothetical protein [Acidipila sp. EB88]RRA48440.1 hypothetical protein D1Y84_09200 [Acidipila sp. EB88]